MTVKNPNTGQKQVRKIRLKVEENGVERDAATVAEAVAAQNKSLRVEVLVR